MNVRDIPPINNDNVIIKLPSLSVFLTLTLTLSKSDSLPKICRSPSLPDFHATIHNRPDIIFQTAFLAAKVIYETTHDITQAKHIVSHLQ